MIRKSCLLLGVAVLALTGCAREADPVAVTPAPVQPSYDATGYRQPVAPVYAGYPAPVQSYSSRTVYPAQTIVRTAVPAPRASAPVQSYRTVPEYWADAAPLSTRTPVAAVRSAAPQATPLPANRVTVAPRAGASQPRQLTEIERLNPGMPRLSDADRARLDETRTPYPRPKPVTTRQSGVHVAQLSGTAPVPRASTMTLGVPTYSSSQSGGGLPPTIEYNIPHLPQEEPLWCWAAAAQQAIGWVNNGRAPAQCAIVALAHGISPQECCSDREGVCARTGEIPAIAALVRRFGGQAAETASVPRDPKEIYRILESGGTLLIRLRPAPHDQAAGIRHMIVVRGIEWLRLPNGQLHATLLYNDPLGAGQRAVDFEEIVGFFEQALIVRRSS